MLAHFLFYNLVMDCESLELLLYFNLFSIA